MPAELVSIRHQAGDRFFARFRMPDGREIACNVSRRRLQHRAATCRTANETHKSERIQQMLELTEWLIGQLPESE